MFSIQSKNGLYCSLCDYSFHKTLMEEQKINFSDEFCNTMISETFEFTSIYHLQLTDYFNNLLEVLQCDPLTGNQTEENI